MRNPILTFCILHLCVQLELISSAHVKSQVQISNNVINGDENCDDKKGPCEEDSSEEEDDSYNNSAFDPPFGIGIAIALVAVLILLKITFYRIRRGSSCRSRSNRSLEPATPNVVYSLPRQFENVERGNIRRSSEISIHTTGHMDARPPPYSQVAKPETTEKSQQNIELEPPPPYNPETMKI